MEVNTVASFLKAPISVRIMFLGVGYNEKTKPTFGSFGDHHFNVYDHRDGAELPLPSSDRHMAGIGEIRRVARLSGGGVIIAYPLSCVL